MVCYCSISNECDWLTFSMKDVLIYLRNNNILVRFFLYVHYIYIGKRKEKENKLKDQKVDNYAYPHLCIQAADLYFSFEVGCLVLHNYVMNSEKYDQ